MQLVKLRNEQSYVTSAIVIQIHNLIFPMESDI